MQVIFDKYVHVFHLKYTYMFKQHTNNDKILIEVLNIYNMFYIDKVMVYIPHAKKPTTKCEIKQLYYCQ